MAGQRSMELPRSHLKAGKEPLEKSLNPTMDLVRKDLKDHLVPIPETLSFQLLLSRGHSRLLQQGPPARGQPWGATPSPRTSHRTPPAPTPCPAQPYLPPPRPALLSKTGLKTSIKLPVVCFQDQRGRKLRHRNRELRNESCVFWSASLTRPVLHPQAFRALSWVRTCCRSLLLSRSSPQQDPPVSCACSAPPDLLPFQQLTPAPRTGCRMVSYMPAAPPSAAVLPEVEVSWGSVMLVVFGRWERGCHLGLLKVSPPSPPVVETPGPSSPEPQASFALPSSGQLYPCELLLAQLPSHRALHGQREHGIQRFLYPRDSCIPQRFLYPRDSCIPEIPVSQVQPDWIIPEHVGLEQPCTAAPLPHLGAGFSLCCV
ncbi:uncharacterized protein LOC111940166 isoform X1 [Cyanistes caeruleus]|uniref:uncharacterized protein LOC111940166 isoform X1 n=1 Tax=Cyanistes caeruleus TaxID=156563 RepID=UPI000CDACFD4|nr:uncharacterized protein LOC111940166 isoform X1 [Cyanistes caeruleus]